MGYKEFIMPTWPTIFPLFLTYRREAPFPHGGGDNSMRPGNDNVVAEVFPHGLKGRDLFYKNPQIPDHKFQMLYECEEERFVYKACLRELLSLRRSKKHTSWETGDISSLYLS
jgi:hypothetical protein